MGPKKYENERHATTRRMLLGNNGVIQGATLRLGEIGGILCRSCATQQQVLRGCLWIGNHHGVRFYQSS